MSHATDRRRGHAERLLASLQPSRSADGDYVAVPPGFWRGRAFGGVVVAQAVAAAMHAARSAEAPHSMHAYFLRPVATDVPVRMTAQVLREGRSFRTFELRMSQQDRPVFVMTCQFHGDEPGEAYQPRMAAVPPPDECEEQWPRGPVETRVVGPTPVREDGTYESTRRAWLRVLTTLPADPIVTAAVAAYVSDLTGNGFRPRSLDRFDGYTDASLDHAIWFHRPIRLDQWAFFDVHCAINHGGRSLIRGGLYDADGRLCLSMAQELLIRPIDRAETEA